mgnify:CR=1 FL=1|jgi:hypothetical protein
MDRRDNLSLNDYNNMHGNMVGNIYYHICEDNRKYYRTIRIARDPYKNTLVPQISNPVYGNPPEGIAPISPLLLNRLQRNRFSMGMMEF